MSLKTTKWRLKNKKRRIQSKSKDILPVLPNAKKVKRTNTSQEQEQFRKIPTSSVSPLELFAAPEGGTPTMHSSTVSPSIPRLTSRAGSLVQIKRFITRSRKKKDNDIPIDIFSLHGYSSMRMMLEGPKSCAHKAVLSSWIVICLQILALVAFSNFYYVHKIIAPVDKLQQQWKADCSQVDRCHRFSQSMLLGGAKRSSYVCSAKLSKRLPMWSNDKHCAECPPLVSLTPPGSKPTEQFGLIDDTAAVYFDFWSDGPEKLSDYALYQSMHDVNGPFTNSCSVSRATNAFGLAGVDGSDYCVDCFGNMCSLSSYSKPEVQNIMTAAHCKERFACDAFDYDGGRCNKAFFNTVCNTSTASVGDKPTYPRRFSDLPGFGWFRNWPHSFEESCALSAKLTTLKTADGRYINASEHHRLRALCHLHTRCVREHPDAQCDQSNRCEIQPTTETRMRNEFAQNDVDTVFWSLEFSAAAHLPEFGGAILWPAAVFMFYLVASEMSFIQTSATQHWICLEIAYEERDNTHESCGSKVCLHAARALLVLSRDFVVIGAVQPTVMSIVSVTTAFDVIFCGAIAVVVLQVDQVVFSTIMTDAGFDIMAHEYRVSLTRRYHEMLQVEITFVFCSAFFWMMVGYVGTVSLSLQQMEAPDGFPFVDNYIWLAQIGFAATDLVAELFGLCWEKASGIKSTKRQIAVRLGVYATRKLFALICMQIITVTLDTLVFSRSKSTQALYGDIEHKHSISMYKDLLNLIYTTLYSN